MSIVLWSASAMVITSIPLAGWALLGDRTSSRKASQNLVDHSPTLREAELQRSPVERVVLPMTRQVGARLLRFTPTGWVESRRLMVGKAGLSGRVNVEQIIGAKLMLPGLLAALFSLRLIGDAQPRIVLLMIAAMTAGFFAPDVLVRAKADRRAEAITRALPDMLDQVTISVEAGLGFEPALARTSEGQSHPLAQEFLRMLQDVRLGSARVGCAPGAGRSFAGRRPEVGGADPAPGRSSRRAIGSDAAHRSQRHAGEAAVSGRGTGATVVDVADLSSRTLHLACAVHRDARSGDDVQLGPMRR